MVYRQKEGHAFKVRVSNKARTRSAVLTTGCKSQEEADKVAAFYQRCRDRKEWALIDSMLNKVTPLTEAYEADQNGELDQLVADLKSKDLDPLVTEWEEGGAKPRYVLHVRGLIPKGVPFPASRLTRPAISKFLGGLRFTDSTKNRYRVALSQFAGWLVEQEVIDSNIVRDVKGKEENRSRDVWHTWSDAKLLIDALPEPYKALESLMAGTGMEWQAIAALKRRDVDLKLRTVRAHGHKNKYRNRLVRITEAWTLPVITKHLKHLTPNAPVFTINHDRALDVHHAACTAAGVQDSRLHDWRHTYAVNNLQAGMRPQVVKRQLGHAPNSTVVERIYGVWIVDEKDYQLRVAK